MIVLMVSRRSQWNTMLSKAIRRIIVMATSPNKNIRSCVSLGLKSEMMTSNVQKKCYKWHHINFKFYIFVNPGNLIHHWRPLIYILYLDLLFYLLFEKQFTSLVRRSSFILRHCSALKTNSILEFTEENCIRTCRVTVTENID